MSGRRVAKIVRLGALPLALALCALLLLAGAFGAVGTSRGQVLAWALLVGSGAGVGARQLWFLLRVRRGQARTLRTPRRFGAEAAVWMMLAVFALVERTGGLGSPVQPLLYLLGAGLALALPPVQSAPLVTVLVAFDVLLHWSRGGLPAQWPALAAQGAFVVLFAVFYHALLSARLLRARQAEEGAVRRRVEDAQERARELRLMSTSAPDEDAVPAGPGLEDRQLLATVGELEAVLRGSLEIAGAALQPHTAAVFLLSPDGDSARLRECVSASERLFRGPLSSRAGALGAVLSTGRPVRLFGDGPALSYYQGDAPVQAFLGVPLRERLGAAPAEPVTQPGPPAAVEALQTRAARSDPAWILPAQDEPRQEVLRAFPEGQVIGALVVDRQLVFSSADERVLEALAAEVARALEAERLLVAVRREKEEKARFFRALEDFNRATTAQQAAEIAVAHARRICPGLDLCALSVREQLSEVAPARGSLPKRAFRRKVGRKVTKGLLKPGLHRVLAASGDGAALLQDLAFADNAGLVCNVVRSGQALPAHADSGAERGLVLDGATPLRGLTSLKVFPLRAGNTVVGALLCGARRKGVLSAPAQRELSMLALQAGEAVVRTRLFETTERLATTDGLTGLLNRRTLMAQLELRFSEARRYGRPLSFLLLDVDHFKKVNDTWGHPAGDAVLRGVAQVAESQARETDLVGRYGGEEMGLVLPETDSAGARVIAERLCRALAATDHESDKGPLRVTASIGVSTLGPGVSFESVAELLEAADAALYRAKQAGRNRVALAEDKKAA